MKTSRLVCIIAVVGCSLLGIATAIEKPEYKLLKKEGKFQLREYEKLHIVTATMDQEEQRNQAFRKLAGYIGKQNDKQQKIAMTAPVIIDGSEKVKKDKKAKVKMSFVIPQDVVKAGIPKPTDDSIQLSETKKGQYAVTSFKYSNSEEARTKALGMLREWIAKEKLVELSEPSYAFYNPPWIPQIMRTNEVWIRVGKKK